jgi:hypothetical protein
MVGAFTVLLFTKTFHWLAQARVEHVGRTEGTTLVQHLKLFALQVRPTANTQHLHTFESATICCAIYPAHRS